MSISMSMSSSPGTRYKMDDTSYLFVMELFEKNTKKLRMSPF